MNRTGKIVTRTAVAVAVTTAPVIVAATANAGPYNTSPITVSNSRPAAGGQLHVQASGYKPNSMVQIYLHSTPVLLGTVRADANGVIDTIVQIPSDLAAGSSHAILAEGVDPSGKTITNTVNITVGGNSTLPFTGVDALGVGAAGAGLVGFGSFLLFASRRKRAARVG